MRILALKEPGLPVSYNADGILAYLGKRAEIAEVTSEEIIAGANGDIFYNTHGAYYPIGIEEALFAFFRDGGSLLHIGSMPFDHAMKSEGGSWTEVKRTLGDIRDHEGYGNLDEEADVFRRRIGMTQFVPGFENMFDDWTQVFDKDLVGDICLKDYLPERSFNYTTTVPLELFYPKQELIDSRSYHGRPVCRDTIYAGWVIAPDGQKIMPSLMLTKYWGNPYNKDQTVIPKPWAVFTGIIPEDGAFPEQILDSMMDYIDLPTVLKITDQQSATLHEGEEITIRANVRDSLPDGWSLKSYAAKQKACELGKEAPPCYKLQGSDQVSLSYDRDVMIEPFRFELIDEAGRVRDYTESAVAIWDPEFLKKTRRIEPDGCYFKTSVAGQPEFSSTWLNGTNWQDRAQYALTWHNPNPLRIAQDAAALARGGMTIIRTHYFMPGWFRVMPGGIFNDAFRDFYGSFEKGPELSERHLRAIEAHVIAFSNFGITMMPTVYTNPGVKMGNPAHWVGTSRLTRVKMYIENQKVFGRQLMERFGGCASVTWDICNEKDTEMYHASEWLSEHRKIFGATGQMVGLGTFTYAESIALGESMDWQSEHIPCCKTKDVFRTGKPCLLQEAWVPTPCTRKGEDDIEEVLNKSFAWTVKFGGCTVMPWNWNMNMVNWRYRVGFVDYWDLELGCCTHPDATPRRGSKVMRNWATFMRNVSFDQSINRQVVLIYPKICITGGGPEYVDFLRKQNIPFIGVNDRDFAGYDLSQTKVVFAPYYAQGYREDTWQALRKFAENGGLVFAHNDVMMLDENGEWIVSREAEVPEIAPAVETVGKGCIRWYMGYNESDPLSICDPELLEGLDLVYRDELCIPLKGGRMVIEERLSTNEKTMDTDWIPNDPLPDRNIPLKMEIQDISGNALRCFAKEGKQTCIAGIKISGQKPYFAVKVDENTVVVSGTDFILCSDGALDFELIDYSIDGDITPVSVPCDLKCEEKDGITTIRQDGWAGQYWVKITRR